MWGVYIYIYIGNGMFFFNDIYHHVEENGLYIYMDMRMGKLVSGLGSHRNKRIKPIFLTNKHGYNLLILIIHLNPISRSALKHPAEPMVDVT